MTTYRFRASCIWWLHILVSLVSLSVCVYFLVFLEKRNVVPTDYLWIPLLFTVALSTFVTDWATSRKVEIEISENAIKIHWLKRLLAANQPDVTIPFSEITEYKYQSIRYYTWLTICRRHKKDYRICDPILFWSGYSDFVVGFINALKNYNEQMEGQAEALGETPPQGIQRALNFSETPLGFYLPWAILFFLILCAALVDWFS